MERECLDVGGEGLGLASLLFSMEALCGAEACAGPVNQDDATHLTLSSSGDWI
jgi:hypothetical protein